MEYGGITPVGLPADWPVWVDGAVADTELVCIGAGVRGAKLLLPGAALLRLPNAERVDDLARDGADAAGPPSGTVPTRRPDLDRSGTASVHPVSRADEARHRAHPNGDSGPR